MKKQLLTKLLLVAVALLVGGGKFCVGSDLQYNSNRYCWRY